MGNAEQKILEHLSRGLDAVFGDDKAYRSYLKNRDLNVSREALIGFYGEEPVRRFEARYIREWNVGARMADDTIPEATREGDCDPFGRPLREGM